jgi:hydrogenase nickel incorporation protein HypA/HybF
VHELSIVRSLCQQARRLARLHGAVAVRSLTLEIGALSGVVPDLLETAFETYRVTDPMCAGARLTIRRVPLILRCEGCESESRPETFRFLCPACGEPRVRVVRGEELMLRDLELEVAPEHEDGRDPTSPRDGEPAARERRSRAGTA